jgi:hypothetical protein
MSTIHAATAEAHIAVEPARGRVYDAECALHATRQTHVDAWIAAAAEHLHQALLGLGATENVWQVSGAR